jgi:hypothetical protein
VRHIERLREQRPRPDEQQMAGRVRESRIDCSRDSPAVATVLVDDVQAVDLFVITPSQVQKRTIR